MKNTADNQVVMDKMDNNYKENRKVIKLESKDIHTKEKVKKNTSTNDEHLKEVFVKKNRYSKPKTPQRQRIEEYLNIRFKFRFNTILEKTEWTFKAKNDFKIIDDYDLNTFQRNAENELGITVSSEKIKNTLASDFTAKYDPFKDYFESLPMVKDCHNISKLASTVTTQNNELFELSLTKWLVSTVANALTYTGCQNQTALVLTGTQGAFKTTWLNLLCPPILSKNYHFCGKININLESKDTVILLAEKLIINLDDQLRKINNRDSETVKTLISQGEITVRKPYGQYNSELPRRASFCGSINGKEFLTDTTGSRRFLPFEAEAINIKEAQSIDIDLVWAEAMQLYLRGYKYYFDKDEINELFKGNEDFQVFTPEYELILEYFEIPCKDDIEINYLSTSLILSRLEDYTKQKIDVKKVGEALTKIGFNHTSKRIEGGSPRKVWLIKEKSIEQVNLERKLEM